MNILIAGGSGFIGKNLSLFLSQKHDICLLSRSKNHSFKQYQKIITWDELNADSIKDFDLIINLSGYNIADKNWSNKVKEKILQSRLQTTQKLVDLIADQAIWFINASAIGFYPFSFNVQTENNHLEKTNQNSGFSQEVVEKWEAIVNRSKLEHKTIVRFGVVIGNGGMLKKLLLPTKIGIGSVVGTGEQLISWIQMDDLISAIDFIIENNYKNKIFNLTSPNVITQKALTRSLAEILKRPQFLSMPKIMVKLLFGQMGEELLLSSHHIKPQKLINYGFKFKYPHIDQAIEHSLNKDN